MTKIVLPRPPERYDPAVEAQRNLILEQALARGGGGGAWGTITGTLSAQTDLQAALDAKLDDSQATAFGLSLLGAADAPAARGLLGVNNNWTVVTANTTMVAGLPGYLSAPTGGDPFSGNVRILLNFNGANGSTTFTDAVSRTWAAGGNAQLSTAQFRFGTASARFDGSGDWISSSTTAADSINTGDFTIEFWIRWNTFGANKVLCISANDAANYWDFLHDSTTGPGFYTLGFTPIVRQNSNTGWSTGVWYHVALVRSGNSFTIYRDGSSVATGTSSASLGSYSTISIGGTSLDGTRSADAWVDSFRFTPGVARYTSNFTPPSTEPALSTPIDFTIPATIAPGDFFAVNAAVGTARMLPGAGRQIGTAGVGTAVSLSTGQTLRVAARSTTQLDIV